jgi:hypothetical protein
VLQEKLGPGMTDCTESGHRTLLIYAGPGATKLIEASRLYPSARNPQFNLMRRCWSWSRLHPLEVVLITLLTVGLIFQLSNLMAELSSTAEAGGKGWFHLEAPIASALKR